MKLKHLLFALPMLFAGEAFSQINNQFTSAQTSANAWISGVFRANTGFELNSTPGAGGYLLYNSSLTTGDISGKLRWVIRGQDAETGSNNGFDLAFIRRNDAGVAIDAPLTIIRGTGGVNMPGVVNMGENSSVTSIMKMKGTSTGIANSSWIGFYESNNSTRIGYIGDGSASNSDMQLASDIAGVTLYPANGTVTISGSATSNILAYRNVGIQAPATTTRSLGTKAVWFPTATPATQVDYATGVESGHIWNSVPENNLSYGFKWYGGTSQIAELEGTGNFDAIGILRLGPVSGSERLTARFNALAFNRDVNNGAIFSNTGHAYQFTHTASTTATSDLFDLQVYNPSGGAVTAKAFSVNGAGNIGMGINPQAAYKLAVNGTVGARRVKVSQETWADYVFQPEYKLPTLAETEAFINTNKHLPGIPSEKEVVKDGIDVGEMNKLLLQKIEEQMLYIIEMNKEVKALKDEVKELKQKKN